MNYLGYFLSAIVITTIVVCVGISFIEDFEVNTAGKGAVANFFSDDKSSLSNDMCKPVGRVYGSNVFRCEFPKENCLIVFNNGIAGITCMEKKNGKTNTDSTVEHRPEHVAYDQTIPRG